MKLRFIILLHVLCCIRLFAQSPAVLTGTITGDTREPLPFVNVYIGGTFDGTMTDEHGNFRFSTNATGDVELIASMVGYRQYSSIISLTAGEDVHFEIFLQSTVIETQTVVVSASSYGTEEGKGVVLTPMEILMTPGGAADIFQTLKTLPGLTQVSESAELYVRGGDPTETVTLFDQASLYHPYTYESAYGGLFSNLNTNIVKSMYFSSGGFSAKYGNVLSGVLDIQSANEPVNPAYNIGVNLAGAGFSAHIPVAREKFGFRFDARQTYTKPLMVLHGTQNEFTLIPESRDASLLLSGRYSDTGRAKVYALFADDRQGVKIDRPEYSGAFEGASKNYLVNLQHSDMVTGSLLVRSSVSTNRYTGEWKLGVLDLERIDEVSKFRSDAVYEPGQSYRLLFGGEAEKRTFRYLGTIPDNDYDLRPGAERTSLDVSLGGTRVGLYGEIEYVRIPGLDGLFVIGGVRFDRINEIGSSWLDPRFSAGYLLGDHSTIRLSWGIFRQNPDPRLYDPANGNPDLKPMKAAHYIAAYDFSPGENTNLRIEAYHKEYSDLPLEHPSLNYDNSGRGYARGVDVLMKGRFSPKIDGWLSYGYIDTKRMWLDYESYAPSSYDVTHSFTLIAKYTIRNDLRTGINYKYATGRPYTPVAGAILHAGPDVYEPLYGPQHSARYRDYHRLDFRLMYFNRIMGRYFTVFYLECLNVLNVQNLFGYTYSRDYSERREISSYFGRRTIVVGMALNL